MKKKKLLFIITQGHWGGAQRYVFDLALNLAEKFDITVAVGEKNGKNDLQRQLATNNLPAQAGKQLTNKIEIVQLNHLIRKISPLQDLLALLEIKKLYKKTKPDIIHLNSSKAGILGSLSKLLIVNCQLLIVYTAHGWVFNEPASKLKKQVYKFLEKFTARFKDKIITLSDKDFFDAKNSLKINPKKLELVRLAIDPPTTQFSKEGARKKLNDFLKNKTETNTFLIGTIANFYSTKGIDVLLKAISLKKDVIPANIKFVVIGNGPEFENYQLQIANYKLQNIIELPGFIKNASELLPAFDLFVLPSRKEGLPYTILEAVNYKIPTLATDVGSISSIIKHKETGLLCQPENPEELMETIFSALKNKHELANFATRAYETQKEFTVQDYLQKTKKLYLSLFQFS